ncbi:unnamed protein product [Phytophthora fragariaefolia]|uniref:Unnamed protein product n=1 Tax=Phytophthora fragariaefolia TaxID=1490495 RepID=A0A9W7CPG5_9STRA|nr:unnamed protein product [Phytophthora fragariaefolia]
MAQLVVFLQTKLATLWKTVQVELQGAYSVERVKDLLNYSNKVSGLRVLVVPLFTPLPSLILVTVVDLVALRPATEGIRANQLFFVRAIVSFWIATVMTYTQFKHIVASMPLSIMQTCQELLITIYPVYFYLFRRIPERGKTGFAALLPIIKLIMRNIVAKTVGHMHDEIPEIVTINVEVFSALFVSYCMQNTPSIQTTPVLMVADALQMTASLYDIEIIIQRLKTIRRQMRVDMAVTNRRSRRKSDFLLAQDIVNRHVFTEGIFSPLSKSIRQLSSTVQPLSGTVKAQVTTQEHSSAFSQLDRS